MKFDREKHQRRSIRLQNYDYSQAGAYFITICSFQRECLFGRVVNDEVELSQFGEVAATCWSSIPQHFPHVELDDFVVMPNHIHGIIVVVNCEDTAGGERQIRKFGDAIAGSLPTIVGSFKSAATKRINIIKDSSKQPVWQRNYYEHIIRDETGLSKIRQYICNNPRSWEQDQLHPDVSSQW